MPKVSALAGLVSRIPARVQVKLLAAFLAIEVLLIVMGAVGLEVLSGVNQRADELIRLQRKIEAYRQVQHDTTSQLYSVASLLLSSDDLTLSSTLRQLPTHLRHPTVDRAFPKPDIQRTRPETITEVDVPHIATRDA